MRTIERDIVAAILVSKDGKFLQALQNPTGRGVYPGRWGIIGGGIDEGENERAALNREVKEETGIDISQCAAELVHESTGEGEKVLKASGERVHCKMRFHTFRVLLADRNAADIPVTLDDEHTEYRWCAPEELKEMELTEPSRDLFTQLGYL